MNPVISRSLNSGMVSGHFVFSACNEAVSISGNVVFSIALASFSDLDLRTVRIRWSELGDFHETAFNVRVILNYR